MAFDRGNKGEKKGERGRKRRERERGTPETLYSDTQRTENSTMPTPVTEGGISQAKFGLIWHSIVTVEFGMEFELD